MKFHRANFSFDLVYFSTFLYLCDIKQSQIIYPMKNYIKPYLDIAYIKNEQGFATTGGTSVEDPIVNPDQGWD